MFIVTHLKTKFATAQPLNRPFRKVPFQNSYRESIGKEMKFYSGFA